VARAALYMGRPERIAGLKPWSLIAVLSVPPSEYRRQMRGELPLDLWLQKEAEREGKAVCSLESVGEQVAALDSMPLEAQIEALEAILAERDPEIGFATLTRLYGARDLAALAAFWEASLAGLDEESAALARRRFLDERNLRMVERMAPRLAAGDAFIAVGALHLVGESGLLRLLEAAGYRVTAVY
jgi:uncharacterized protein YbaP (TraB family)